MPESQLTLFENVKYSKIVVNDNRQHLPASKNTQDCNVKLPEDLKRWLEEIGSAVSEATGDSKYGASSVGREAVNFYRTFYHIRNKMLKYRPAIISMIEQLK